LVAHSLLLALILAGEMSAEPGELQAFEVPVLVIYGDNLSTSTDSNEGKFVQH
jgi:hypothetical protein